MEPNTLAPYVLRELALHQMNGRRVTLQDLVDDLGVRRADVRKTVAALHEAGHVDALRMAPTMSGFAYGAGLVDVELPPLRRPKLTLIAA